MSTYYIAGYPVSDELYHHGIKGQRWGIRRYQNEDGSLTPAGRERYTDNSRHIQRDLNRLDKERAYIVGDRVKAMRRLDFENRKIKKHGDKSQDWKDKHTNKADEASKNMDLATKRIKEIDDAQRQLIKRAIDQGMNVKVMGIPRRTQRLGERFVNEGAAWAMAIGTSMFIPIGVGVSRRQYTQGMHYSVRKQKN